MPLLVFPCGLAGKESACKVEDLGSIPGLGRSSGERKGYRLQYSGLENSMDCIVHGVTKSHTRLSNFHFTKYSSRGGGINTLQCIRLTAFLRAVKDEDSTAVRINMLESYSNLQKDTQYHRIYANLQTCQ